MSLTEIDRDSRQISIGQKSITETRKYGLCIIDLYIDDLTDHQVALDYFYDNCPAFVTLDVQGYTYILVLQDLELRHRSMYTWEAEATYSLPEDGGQGGGDLVKLGFNTTGGTKTMTKSLAVLSSDKRSDISGGVPNLYGAIGYTKSGVQGTEVLTRGFGFNLTVYFSPEIWNNGFINTIYLLSKCYNNGPFFGFAAGEVLFVDGSAEGSFYERVPVTYNFIANPNVTNAPDPGFPNLTALGHDVVDYLFYDEIGTEGLLLQTPAYRYVHRVYEPANLSILLG